MLCLSFVFLYKWSLWSGVHVSLCLLLSISLFVWRYPWKQWPCIRCQMNICECSSDCCVDVLQHLLGAKAFCITLHISVVIHMKTEHVTQETQISVTPFYHSFIPVSSNTQAHTHNVSCTINALISFSYPLHHSFSSAIRQGTMCLWGSPGLPPTGMLHLISRPAGLFGCRGAASTDTVMGV